MRATVVAAVVLLGAAALACSRSRSAGPGGSGGAPAPSSSSSAAAAVDPKTMSLSWRLYEDPSMFQWKLKPQANDWLARFKEPGQTFAQYEISKPVRPTSQRKKIVLQPLGTLSVADMQLLSKLREHMELFYALTTEMKDAIPFAPQTKKRTRHGEGGRTWMQYETSSIMDEILKKRIPDDAVVYLGVTTTDLYPQEDWNFVFGQARFEERVGVYSLARMFESFDGKPDTDVSRIRGLERSTMILTHEAGHAFGILHCTRFECVMNGSNSLEELDRQFGEPCPVCLHKLTWNIGLDPIKRYKALRDFYRREHIDKLSDWIDRRLTQLEPLPIDDAGDATRANDP